MSNQLALIQKDLAEQLAPAKEILPSHVSFENLPAPPPWRWPTIKTCLAPTARA